MIGYCQTWDLYKILVKGQGYRHLTPAAYQPLPFPHLLFSPFYHTIAVCVCVPVFYKLFIIGFSWCFLFFCYQVEQRMVWVVRTSYREVEGIRTRVMRSSCYHTGKVGCRHYRHWAILIAVRPCSGSFLSSPHSDCLWSAVRKGVRLLLGVNTTVLKLFLNGWA